MGEQAMEEARAALAGGPDARAHGLEAVRHGVGAAVPMMGPWIVGTQDQMVRKAASGDIAGALGTAAGNLAVAAAPEAEEGALGAFRKAARGRLAEMQARARDARQADCAGGTLADGTLARCAGNGREIGPGAGDKCADTAHGQDSN